MKKTVSFTKNATNVFFHILTSCNLACRHCYINPAQHGRDTLPLETIKRWLKVFVERTGSDDANVIFLGGEPTLHQDLAAAIIAARELGYASVTVDTNGYLFHDILDKVTPEQLDYVSFSLDGPTPAVNDPLRGTGSFERCCAGIQQALAKGFEVSVIFTVSSANIDALGKMPELLNNLGVKRFFIQVLGLRGKSAGNPAAPDGGICAQVSPEAWLETVPIAAEAAARLGITTIYPKVYLDPGEPFECAGTVANNFFIFPNGRVYRCPLCEDYPLHAMAFDIESNQMVARPPITEAQLFELIIPEGCVMNKLIQSENIRYTPDGRPRRRIACCMLKEEVMIMPK